MMPWLDIETTRQVIVLKQSGHSSKIDVIFAYYIHIYVYKNSKFEKAVEINLYNKI